MKKFFILFFSLFLIIGLNSCGNNREEVKQQEVKKEVLNNKNNTVEKKEEIFEEELEKFRKEISLDDISKIYIDNSYKAKNKLENIAKEFILDLKKGEKNTLVDNINGGIKKEKLYNVLEKYPKNLVRNFTLKLNILDFQTNEKISNGKIYLNGVILGNIKDGKFEGSFKWLKGIEKFIITVRASGYGDGFIVLNSVNSKGKLLIGDVLLKKSKQKKVTLGKKQKIEFNNTVIDLDECSIVNKKGECVEGNVLLDINFIKGEEANNYLVSLNREALTDEGEIVELASGGMSFINFIGEDGEILKLKDGESIKISYKVSQEDIEKMAVKKYGDGEKEGYWWYDKKNGIWRESSAIYNLDKENKIWTATIKNLY